MVFHPPAIILSYSCIFAAFGSYLYELIYSGSPEAKAARLKAARLFSLFSWIILTAGIVTGGIWAYGELGWGGYWSWDPIENSALVTWLLLTAHLHISGHNKSTGRSPIVLISCTALSVLLGTFLARSGIISSVHAYSSRAGKTVFFLTVLIVAAICLSAFLTVFRKRHRSGTYEFSFNRMARRLPPCLMVLCAVIIALMTISPLFPFEGLNITEKTYDFVFGILGMLILLNLTIYFTLKNKSNKLRILIVTVSLVTGLITLLQPNMASFSVFTRIALVICAFCITSFVLSFISATGKSFSNTGCFLLYIIHLSIVILALGFTGSRNMKTEARIILNKNTTVSMGSYILEMTDFHIFDEPEMKAWNAALSFFDGKKNKDIKITLTHYKKKNMYHSKAYISSSFREDLYIIIENATDDGDILLKVSLYRWVSLIWLGIALMISAAVFLCFRKIPNDS
jgi:cytochrome c-type biogenesis protein CcmF